MALLARGAVIAIVMTAAACYSPDVRDCTVSCSAQAECASSQLCGGDHWCASASVAGQCESLIRSRDAGVVIDAKEHADAKAHADATVHADASTKHDAATHDAATHDAATHDAAPHDAATHDAALDAAPLDAPPAMVTIHVKVDDQGVVSVDGGGACDSADTTTHGDCMLSVPAGTPTTARAQANASGHVFDMWMGNTCSGATPTCTFTPVAMTDIHGKFKPAPPMARSKR